MLIRDYLIARASRSPGRLAYIDAGRRFTWAQTADRAMRLARVLRDRGVRKGDVVASLSLEGIEVIDLWYASAILGSVRTGINWRYAPREIEHILTDARVKVLIAESGGPAAALGGVEGAQSIDVITFGDNSDGYEDLLASASPLVPTEWDDLSGSDMIAISYTTGSTGLPKGALWSHAAVVSAQLHTWIEAGGRRDDIYLHCIPSPGVPILLATWNVCFGATIVLHDRFTPESVLELIQTEHVTSTLLIPTMIGDLLNQPSFSDFDLSSMRLIIYGSAPTTTTLVKRAIEAFACELQQWYGATEGVGGWFTILRHEDHVRALASDSALLQSCGKAMIHTSIRIVSEDGQTCGPGEVGEVFVQSDTVMSGYLGLPTETAETLRDGWLHTGDLGRLDDEGHLFLVDRKKFLIITGGYNVYPVVVEEVLSRHPAVAEVCVVGVPDDRWGEAVCAVVVLHNPGSTTADDLLAFCRPLLAKFEAPKHIVFETALPRGATGKILKRAVKDDMAAALTTGLHTL
ncbi:MAG: class I adenylate-forming enzyme family protein [Solirubrobacterales bacterium]